MRRFKWTALGALCCLLLTTTAAYAEPVSFDGLESPMSGLASDIIPTVGNLLGKVSPIMLVFLGLAATAIVGGLIMSLTRRG